MNHKARQEAINKALKTNAVQSMIPPKEGSRIEGLSSGSISLNRALTGSVSVGYPWGRVVEIFGPESSGKSTLALHAVLEAQRLEARLRKAVPVLYIDLENALDPKYMESIGIDLSNITFSYPDHGEQAFEVMLTALANGYKLIVVDSVDALVPRAEIEGTMTDSHVGALPRLMGKGLRKLCGAKGVLSSYGGVALFINQIRMKVGVVFGNPETTSGGYALKFYATQRVEVRSPAAGRITTGQRLTDDDEAAVELGRTTNCKVVKNKVYPPYRKAAFDIRYGIGIDRASDMVSALEDLGIRSYHNMSLKKVEEAIRAGEIDASTLTAELAAAEYARRKEAGK